MVALSVHDVERFTPARYLVDGEAPAGAPVFLLGAMNFVERGRWKARIAGEGVRFPLDPEMIRAARRVISELNPSNATEFLAIIQAFEDMSDFPNLKKTDEETADEAAARQVEADSRTQILQSYEGLMDQLRQHSAVGTLLSLRTLFHELVPPITAAAMIRGWENVSVPFERVNGVVPDRVLEMLDYSDMMAAGNRAYQMVQVSASQKGN